MVGLALAQADSPAGPPSVSNAISNASRAQRVNLLTLPIGRPPRGRFEVGKGFPACLLLIFAVNFTHFHTLRPASHQYISGMGLICVRMRQARRLIVGERCDMAS